MNVFVVGCTLYVNGNCEHENVQVFGSLEAATARFKELIVADIKEAEDELWEHNELEAALSSNYYESWMEDEYLGNNCHIWLRETEVE